jgi:hypothetical protein
MPLNSYNYLNVYMVIFSFIDHKFILKMTDRKLSINNLNSEL